MVPRDSKKTVIDEQHPRSMDHYQSLTCHLQGDSRAIEPGYDPKLSAEDNGGPLFHFSVTSSAHVTCRSYPTDAFWSDLDLVDTGYGKGKAVITSESCSPSTLCLSSKQLFPWMRESRHTQRASFSNELVSSHGEATLPGRGKAAGRRERTAFTSTQLVELEKEFHFSPYLCRSRRLEMAAGLKITDRQIKIWFQNRRMKYKKDHKDKVKEGPPSSKTLMYSLSPGSSGGYQGYRGVRATASPNLFMGYDHTSNLGTHSKSTSQYICVTPMDLPHLTTIPAPVADGPQSSLTVVDSSNYSTGLSKPNNAHLTSYGDINAHFKCYSCPFDPHSLTHL